MYAARRGPIKLTTLSSQRNSFYGRHSAASLLRCITVVQNVTSVLKKFKKKLDIVKNVNIMSRNISMSID